MTEHPRTLIIACGAIARELLEVVRRTNLTQLRVECLPASYHNHPDRIPAAVEERIVRAKDDYDTIYVGYADCGTGGQLDAVLAKHGVERLPGAHCYEFFSGGSVFASLHDEEPRTFYLTDYLARHFDRLVWSGLGLDRHPQLLDTYFGNYRQLVYLSQVDDPTLVSRAEAAANRLGLAFRHRHVGYGDLEAAVAELRA